MGLCDANKNIIACNNNMRLTFHFSDKQGVNLSEIFEDEGVQQIAINDGQSVPIPTLLIERTEKIQVLGYFFKLENNLLMLGENGHITNEKLAETINFMTMELSSLMHELHQKNIQLNQANNRIQKLIDYDELTGLYNRRYQKERLKLEVSLADRHNIPLSVVMCDLDHFKKVNDTFGHDAGDKVLVCFAQLLKSQTRQEDSCIRFGGEEFVILMPHVEQQEAVEVCDRIRNILATSNSLNNDYQISASFGVAGYQRGMNTEIILIHADRALYQAKDNGRNCVVPYQDKLTVEN